MKEPGAPYDFSIGGVEGGPFRQEKAGVSSSLLRESLDVGSGPGAPGLGLEAVAQPYGGSALPVVAAAEFVCGMTLCRWYRVPLPSSASPPTWSSGEP